jgi:hypothetical protein
MSKARSGPCDTRDHSIVGNDNQSHTVRDASGMVESDLPWHRLPIRFLEIATAAANYKGAVVLTAPKRSL